MRDEPVTMQPGRLTRGYAAAGPDPGAAPRPGTAAVYRERRRCPIDGCEAPEDAVLFILVHLHEAHGWTRAQLMAWTDQVEQGHA